VTIPTALPLEMAQWSSSFKVFTNNLPVERHRLSRPYDVDQCFPGQHLWNCHP
jgi:hypothetical protein